jgi:hypothetical protein
MISVSQGNNMSGHDKKGGQVHDFSTRSKAGVHARTGRWRAENMGSRPRFSRRLQTRLAGAKLAL